MAERKRFSRRAALRRAGTLGAAGAASAALGGPAVAGAAPAVTPGHEMVGTWVVSSPGPATRVLSTFTVDGCSIVTDNEHPRRTPSHGAWMRVGDRQFVTRHMAFRFDPAGTVTGHIELRVVYTVAPDGQSMQGTGMRYEYDVNGDLLQSPFPIVAQANRVAPLLP